MNSLSSFLLGVVSTVAGSWLASKIHVYHDARITHRDEIKQQVLAPIQVALRERYAPLARRESPIASLKYGVKTIDHSVRAEETPATHGTCIAVDDPRESVEREISEALFQDSSQTHHSRLMHDWQEVRDGWTLYCSELAEWLEEIRVEFVEKSCLPSVAENPNGDYAMHENFAIFIYHRLFELGVSSLKVDEIYLSERFSIFDGSANVATGRQSQVNALLAITNELIGANHQKAWEIRRRLENLELKIQCLSSALSLAIAAKRLHGRCDLVSFF